MHIAEWGQEGTEFNYESTSFVERKHYMGNLSAASVWGIHYMTLGKSIVNSLDFHFFISRKGNLV